jgi:hypothetical protein
MIAGKRMPRPAMSSLRKQCEWRQLVLAPFVSVSAESVCHASVKILLARGRRWTERLCLSDGPMDANTRLAAERNRLALERNAPGSTVTRVPSALARAYRASAPPAS